MSDERNLPVLEDDVRQILADIEQLKTKQYIAGDGWIAYKNRRDNSSWDIQDFLLVNARRKYKLTFVPDSDSLAIANVKLYFTDDSGALYDMLPVANSYNQWWIAVAATAGANVNYKIKIIIESTQSGSVTIV